MAMVCIPSLLRDFTGGAERVAANGRTLRQVIGSLDTAYPGLRERLVDEGRDTIHPAFIVAIDGDTGHLGLLQPVADDSEIVFVPAVSGGCGDFSSLLRARPL
jgi:sulfur-carrier protein